MFAQQPIKLAGGQLCSKCLDDRAGVAAILLAMEQLHAAKDKLKCNVAVLISTQEEVTELGAQTGAFTVQPEYAIAVDVTHGRTPDGPSDGVFDLGSGVAVGMGPNLHRGFTKVLIKTAKANDIDYTLEIMEGNQLKKIGMLIVQDQVDDLLGRVDNACLLHSRSLRWYRPYRLQSSVPDSRRRPECRQRRPHHTERKRLR